LPALPPFPTRRSSDLDAGALRALVSVGRKPFGDRVDDLRPGRAGGERGANVKHHRDVGVVTVAVPAGRLQRIGAVEEWVAVVQRSEEHTSELQSREKL